MSKLAQPGDTARRHLAIFLPALAGGGAEKMLLSLADSLVTRNIRVDLILVRQEGELLDQVPAGVRVVHLRCRTPRSAIFALARYLRRERPDTLLSSLYRANIAAIIAGKLAGRSLRVVIREANRTEFIIGRGTCQSLVDHFLISRTYPLADCIVAVSQNVRNSLINRSLSTQSRINVVHNPVPLGGFRQPTEAIPPGEPTVVACGRLVEQKDFATLLRAFARVRRHRNAKLVILGDGPLRHALESLAIQLNIQDSVSFPGFVQNPLQSLRDASVFVHTSLFEGFPNVLLQALTTGCPVVATDSPGGVRELLSDGRFGTLCEVGDDAAIAAAVEAVLDGAVRFPDAREYLQQFDIEHVTDQYMAALFPGSGTGTSSTNMPATISDHSR